MSNHMTYMGDSDPLDCGSIFKDSLEFLKIEWVVGIMALRRSPKPQTGVRFPHDPPKTNRTWCSCCARELETLQVEVEFLWFGPIRKHGDVV